MAMHIFNNDDLIGMYFLQQKITIYLQYTIKIENRS